MKKLLFVLLLFSLTAIAETEFKIITLQHRFASDLLPTIEPMVGADGTATGMNNQLILRAQPERISEIEAIVANLDAVRINRKITVKTSNSLQSQQERVAAKGVAKVGKVTVSNDRRARPNTSRVEVENSSSNTNQNSNQFINVLDGERAFIRVGKLVPFTQEWLTITRRYIQVDRFTDWREVSTGFAVRPRTIGSSVELEITPRIAQLNNQGTIDFEELTTVMRVTLGNWVDIGDTMQQSDEVSRKIFEIQSASSQQNSGLSIKVE